MKPADIIRQALTEEMISEDGDPWELSLLPGLYEDQIESFESRIGFSLPPDTRALLKFTNGIDGGPLEAIDFTSSIDYVSIGIDEESEFGRMTIGFAADGWGNLWAYVLSKDSCDLGPIYYFCHDPPIFLYQSPNLAHFLEELFKMCKPPFQSLIDDVHEDRLKQVWLDNPDLTDVPQARTSTDPVIAEFARTLPDGWKLIDLRAPEIGAGFSYGRCREIRRHPDAMIFGLNFKEPGRFFRWLRRITIRSKQDDASQT